MHKAFWKKQTLTLSLGLLIVSAPALAGYSDDPDCQAVSNSAKASANRAMNRIDEVAKETSAAIARSKSCTDRVLDGANRAITSFGGAGSIGSVGQQVGNNLANQACQMIGRAVPSQATTIYNSTPQVASAVNQGINQVTSGAQPAPDASSAQSPSVWQRLTNLF